jgi:hypothetical protein
MSGSPLRAVAPLHFLSEASQPALSRLALHERRRRPRTWTGRCGTSARPERPSSRRRHAQAVPSRVAEVTDGVDPTKQKLQRLPNGRADCRAAAGRPWPRASTALGEFILPARVPWRCVHFGAHVSRYRFIRRLVLRVGIQGRRGCDPTFGAAAGVAGTQCLLLYLAVPPMALLEPISSGNYRVLQRDFAGRSKPSATSGIAGAGLMAAAVFSWLPLVSNGRACAALHGSLPPS